MSNRICRTVCNQAFPNKLNQLLFNCTEEKRMNKVIYCVVFLSLCHVHVLAIADTAANPETKALLVNMINKISGNGILFGHQNDMISGKSSGDWKDDYEQVIPDTVYNSDIFKICGDYPAVHGYDIGGVGVVPLHQNLDWHNLEFMRKSIIEAYYRKAIVTVSYHMHNPVTYDVIDSVDYTDSIVTLIDTTYTDSIVYTSAYNYGSWVDGDTENRNPFPDILNEGTALNDTLKAFLTATGNYFNSLTTKDTVPNPSFPENPIIRDITVPIIFRPYHEFNSGHFWWGTSTCTEAEYIDLWRYTFEFLTDSMNVHNLLYCFSPYGRTTEAAYLYGYPGDGYVDILGFEISGTNEFYKNADFKTKVTTISTLAANKNKPIALTETGIAQPTIANAGSTYFTDFLTELNQDYAKNIMYALFWRNLGEEWRVPFVGNDLADNFKVMHDTPDLANFESYLSEPVFNYGVGPYVIHQRDFITEKKDTDKGNIVVTAKRGFMKVQLNELSSGICSFYDINGRMILAKKFNNSSFQQKIPTIKGIYYFKVQTKSGQYSQKIWVQ